MAGVPRAAPARAVWLAAAALAVAPLIVFWRGVCGDVLLPSGDTLLHYLPQRLLAARMLGDGVLPLWNPYVYAGYPLFGQAQTGILHPTFPLFFVLPPVAAMNWQVLLCYGLAALGTFAYARALGCGAPAAAFAGLGFAFSGFMVSHLEHVVVTQAVASLPWVLWSLERLRGAARFRYVLAGALALAASIAAGHPQVPAYLLMLAALYVLWFGVAGRPPVGRPRYLALSAALVAAGLLLSAVQVVPTAELAGESRRAALTFGDFVSYSLPLSQLPGLLFPYLFGGVAPRGYWGAWNLSEVTGYTGAAALMLALAACGSLRRDRHVAFWAAFGLLALLLALGDVTPLAQLTFRLPVYGLFRAQGRHLLLFNLAVAVLAALALRSATPRALRRGAALIAAAALVLALAAIGAGELLWGGFASATAAALRPGAMARNPMLLLPLAAVAAAAGAVIALARRRTPARLLLVLAVQAVDLWVFAQLYPKPLPPAAAVMAEPPYLASLQALPAARVAFVGGRFALSDHRHALWGVEMVNGYDPLMLSRLAEVAGGIPYSGELAAARLAQQPYFLDLLHGRHLVVAAHGVEPPLEVVLQPGERIELAPPAASRAERLEIASYLGNALGLVQGAAAARVTVFEPDGHAVVLPLRAGADTAEWALDLPGVAARALHQRAAVAPDLAGMPGGHVYQGTLRFEPPLDVARVRIENLDRTASLSLVQLALGSGGASRPLRAVDALRADTERWTVLEATPRWTLVENRAARPRAWLVGRTRVLPPAAVLAAVRTARLPDGQPFDAGAEALLETGVGRDFGGLDPAAEVVVTARSPHAIELHSRSARAGFLVLSEMFYPGWRAEVDGVETPILRADYVLRGLELPAGAHRIRFVYDPSSLRLGAAISAATALALVGAGIVRYTARQSGVGF